MAKQKEGFDWKSEEIGEEELLLIELQPVHSVTTKGEIIETSPKRTTTMSKELYANTMQSIEAEDKARKDTKLPAVKHILKGSTVLDVAVVVPVKNKSEISRKTVAKSELTEEDKKAIETFAK